MASVSDVRQRLGDAIERVVAREGKVGVVACDVAESWWEDDVQMEERPS